MWDRWSCASNMHFFLLFFVVFCSVCGTLCCGEDRWKSVRIMAQGDPFKWVNILGLNESWRTGFEKSTWNMQPIYFHNLMYFWVKPEIKLERYLNLSIGTHREKCLSWQNGAEQEEPQDLNSCCLAGAYSPGSTWFKFCCVCWWNHETFFWANHLVCDCYVTNPKKKVMKQRRCYFLMADSEDKCWFSLEWCTPVICAQ